MSQLTRLEKFRNYRKQIAKLPSNEALLQTDAGLLSPQKAHSNEQPDDGIHHTTSIPVTEILKATSEISGMPEADDELDEKRLNRRFVMKVALICFIAVVAIIALVAWIINGGNR